jgi:hypothetical protein
MRRSTLIIAMTLLLLPAPASGTQNSTVLMDSTWWNSLDAQQQIVAVQSAISTYSVAELDGGLRLALQQKLPLSGVRIPRDEFPHTFGYYTAAISDFYVRHTKARDADIGSVMGCLAQDAMQSCEQFARLLEHAPLSLRAHQRHEWHQ